MLDNIRFFPVVPFAPVVLLSFFDELMQVEPSLVSDLFKFFNLSFELGIRLQVESLSTVDKLLHESDFDTVLDYVGIETPACVELLLA